MLTSIIALAALVLAYMARKSAVATGLRLAELEAAVTALRRELARLPPRATRGASQSPETGEDNEPAATPSSPTGTPSDAPPPGEKKPGTVPSVTASGPMPKRFRLQKPASARSLEQSLGTQWAVWAGGLALALGGLFLVRYSIEAGLLGPGVRIILGLLLAAGLLAAGEWFRRTDKKIPIDALPQAHIPSILTAAGTIVAFGSVYAAHALYGFIGPALAFAGLGAIGIAAMLAAALHGPALAGLGLAGAFLAPILVQSSEPDPWPVVLYLAVVATAAYVLARTRTWLWLALAALAGGFIWGLLLLEIQSPSTLLSLPASAIHTLIHLTLAAAFLAIEPNAGVKDAGAEIDRVGTSALAVTTLLAVLTVGSMEAALATIIAFAVIAIVVLGGTAWRTAPAAVGVAFGGLVALAVLLVWPHLDAPPPVTLLAPWAEQLLRLPDNVSSFLTFAALSTLIPSAIASLRLWQGALLKPSVAALYGIGITAPPLLALILSYLRVTQFDVSIPFAASSVALAAAFSIGAEKFHRADLAYSSRAYNVAAGILAAAAIAAFAFALTATLERGYLTVALALTAFGTAYVATLRDVPLMRHAVSALGLAVLARIVWNPRIMGEDVGATPILNWLLVGYAVPAAAFWGAARLLEKRGDSLSVRVSDALAIIFVWLLAFFEIRHATNGGDVFHPGSSFLEAGLLTLTALGLSLGLASLNLQRSNPVFDLASLAFGALSLAIAAFGLLFAVNPLFTDSPVAGPAGGSTLLPAYLLPGLAALFVARATRGLRPDWYVRACAVLGVVLITVYVSLEVRHAFQGPLIALSHPTSSPEHWAHSFAWLILGVAFLAYGLWRRSLEARTASAALIGLAALKITLYDLSGIEGFWRALSFICLGAILIGIGLVYQKIVFAPDRTKPGAAKPPP